MTIPEGVTSISFRHLLLGNELQFALWFHSDPAPTSEQLIALAEELGTEYINDILHPVCSNQLYLVEIYAKYESTGTPEFTSTLDMPANGVGTNGTMPNQSAIVTTFYTATASRRGRGRAFFGGMDKSEDIGGLWSPASVAAINTFLTAVADAHTADDFFEWVVVSRAGTDWSGVTSWTPRVIPAGLNKRRVGRGS